MTFEERIARAAVVETETQTARERLAAALRAMDYARALDLQKEIIRLERDARRLRWPRRARPLKVRPLSEETLNN